MSAPAPRRAVAGDLDALAATAAARSATGWTRAMLAEEIGREDSIFLTAGEGYAVARVQGDECRLLDIAVPVDGCGLGRALLAALAAEARARGRARLTLEVSERNARARRLYEAAGARVVGRRPKFYDDGSDALLMDLDL